MFKVLLFGIGYMALVTLTACTGPPKPINPIYLSNSQVSYAVETTVRADSIRVKDVRGNTICYKKNVDLVIPRASARFGFCTVKPNHLYIVETTIGKYTYTDRIYGKE